MNKKKYSLHIIIMVLSVINVYSNLGKLRVSVIDTKGKPISGVKITLVDSKIKTVIYKITTNKNGTAMKTALKNHFFNVTAEKEGYQTLKTGFKIPVGILLKEEIVMKTIQELEKEREDNDPHFKAVKIFNEASTLITNREFDEALKAINESLSLDNNIYQAHYYLGVIYFEKKKYKEAITPLKEAIKLNDKHAPSYRLLVSVYDVLKNKKESDRYLELAKKMGGKTAIDAFNEGTKFFNEGLTDKAIVAFEEAVKLDPKLVDAYYRLGLSYLNKGLTEKSIFWFKKYLEFKPSNKENVQTAKSIIDSYK